MSRQIDDLRRARQLDLRPADGSGTFTECHPLNQRYVEFNRVDV